MSLAPGDRLGPYEIVAPLGAGGMGEVYRAHDTRLDRTVAIKVLPEELAADSQFRERFDREARAISQLTHPHICTLYDVGQHHGLAFLVMEYLDGETLAARLEHGALPSDDALKIAIHIADALATAHRAGIVHRDLKPGNVMLTRNGAKLLDFGLAKAAAPSAAAGLSMLPTTPPNLTAQGTILGTFQYMAPEQLEGKDADARTDIFALGAMMYEMVTGRKAFTGSSQASLIASIMSSRPAPVSTLRPTTPPELDRIVSGCLEKDPDTRWQSARDIHRELQWIADGQTSARRSRTGSWRASPIASVAAGALGVAIALAIAAGAIGGRRESGPRAVTRSVIPFPSGTILDDENSSYASVALSPDGETLAFSASINGRIQLFTRRLNESSAKAVPGTDGTGMPFFSPDGRWLGFAEGASKKLRKVSLSGGAPQDICVCDARGASWGRDGSIVFGTNTGGLFRVSADGGTPQTVTTPNRAAGEKAHRYPDLLPGGKAAVMMVGTADITSYDDARIELVTLDSGQRRVLLTGGMYPRYVSSGHLVYARGGSLLAVPFDIRRLAVTGPPVTVVEDLLENPSTAFAEYAVSNAGSLAYARGGARIATHTLVWVDPLGRVQPAADLHRSIVFARLSPDGQRVALQIDGATVEIWIHDFARATTSRLAYGWDNAFPIWTPDGRRVTFNSTRATHESYTLFWQAADGTGAAEPLTNGAIGQAPMSWSPDGKTLAFAQAKPASAPTPGSSGQDLWILPVGGPGLPKRFLETGFTTTQATFSPDSLRVAYISDQTGRREIYVRAYPGPSPSWQISLDGGTNPVWAPDGHQLFFRNGKTMMGADVSTGKEFTATRPRRLFESDYYGGEDVARDGRFLMIKPDPSAPVTQLELVQNWAEELKARVVSR